MVMQSIQPSLKKVLPTFAHRAPIVMIAKASGLASPLIEVLILFACILSLPLCNATAQSHSESSTDFLKYALKLRAAALLQYNPKVVTLPTSPLITDSGRLNDTGLSVLDRRANVSNNLIRSPWKLNIVTTIFWIGERPTAHNPVPNNRSSWDRNWSANYGGYDNPNATARRNFIPVNFVPRQNPFYVALPYNDVAGGHTKPEAKQVIPWFKSAFTRDGQSVLKGRWLAIRHGNRACYAQWEDCGPFRTDHWRYVFGNERPKPNINHGAGLDISPAVRDYLNLGSTDVCDWKFVEFREVPSGPWAMYGANNPFVLARNQSGNQFARRSVSLTEAAD